MPARPDDVGTAGASAAASPATLFQSGPASAQPLDSSTVPGGSARLRALAALSGSLTDALTPEAAAYLVEQKALTALGAVSAVVVTLGAFPPRRPSRGAPPGSWARTSRPRH